MLVRNSFGFYTSSIINCDGIVHGYSGRTFGDVRRRENRDAFLRILQLPPERLVAPEQIHNARVHVVELDDVGKLIPGVDALVFQDKSQNWHSTSPILSVRTADCLPLLFADPVTKMVAAAHAGWKGTRLNIAAKVIRKMQQCGAKPADIRASLGPHIGPCCYCVPRDRAELFEAEFDQNTVVSTRDGRWYVDLGRANVRQLLSAGVLRAHIDDSLVCTSCCKADFFSLRRNGKIGFGETMGVIGFKLAGTYGDRL